MDSSFQSVQKVLLFLSAVIAIGCLIGLVSGASDQVIKLGTDQKIVYVCQLNTTACTASATANISIIDPYNSSFIVNNSPMTYFSSSSFFYYNFSPAASGTYHALGMVVDGTNKIPFSFDFEVNPTGIRQTTERTWASIASIIGIFIVVILFFGGVLVFQHPTAKISLGVISAIFLLAGINLILNLLTNSVTDPSVISVFDFITGASFYMYWLLGGILLIVLFLTGLISLLDQKELQRIDKYKVP